ncbi:MAG: two-component regulator propeller domain-containing protein [Deltaproteobacteria bacterium]|nr:two-component regulator propeller domain-containing protein [Deltaproteobacteria bacterium]
MVETLFCDREGTIWIGTSGTGLFRKAPGLVDVPTISDTRVGVFSVLKTHDSKLWVTSTAGVDVLDQRGAVLKHFSLEALDIWSPRGMAETEDHKILIAADGFGVLYGDETGSPDTRSSATTYKLLRLLCFHFREGAWALPLATMAFG